MPTRRKPSAPLPADFDKLFPDEDRFDQFMVEWRKLEKLQRVKLDRIPNILSGAWFHAGIERIIHEGLNRSDFLERSQRIRNLLGNLIKEIRQLVAEDYYKPVATLAALRARRVVLRPRGISFGEAIFDGKPDPSKPGTVAGVSGTGFSFKPSLKALIEVWESFNPILEQLGAPLRRAKGQQARPWIAPAQRDLRAAGLTKDEAIGLLCIMGLKLSKSAEPSRQTIPRR